MAVVPSTAPSAMRMNSPNQMSTTTLDESFESKRKKLFLRPRSTPAAFNRQLCGTNKKGQIKPFDTKSVSYFVKLAIRRKTRLDLLRDQFPRPDGSVPPTALPTWFEIDAMGKIPYLPAPERYMYYARGKLGVPLHRCHPYYSIYDIHHRTRVVNSPYNALHDPYARNYLFKPSVRSFLCRQGFINDRNEVYCSIREFNQFRGYLGTLFNDEVGHALFRRDICWKNQRQQMFNVQSYLSNTGGRQAFLISRRVRAAAYQRELRENKLRNFGNKERAADLQVARFREQRAKDNLMRVMLGYERDKRAAERRYQIQFQTLMMQRNMLQRSTMRDIEVEERRKNKLLLAQRTVDKFKIDWLDSKLEFGKKQLEQDRMLEEAMRMETAENAKKRQRQVEHNRALLPARIAKAKELKAKKWEIVRKFAMRWLEKVRRRLNAPKDLLHESVWIGNSKSVLDDTLRYLKEISGYEKLDDFILNIIKLKRQIQHQIELEEAEEAAALAAEAAGGPHHEHVHHEHHLGLEGEEGDVSEAASGAVSSPDETHEQAPVEDPPPAEEEEAPATVDEGGAEEEEEEDQVPQ